MKLRWIQTLAFSLPFALLLTEPRAIASEPISLKYEGDLDLKCCPLAKCPLVSVQVDLNKTVQLGRPATLDSTERRLTISGLRTETVFFEGFRVADFPLGVGRSSDIESFDSELTLTKNRRKGLESIDLRLNLGGDQVLNFRQTGTADAQRPEKTAADRIGVNGLVDVYWFTSSVDRDSLAVLRNLQPPDSGLGFGQRQELTDDRRDSVFTCVLKIPTALLD